MLVPKRRYSESSGLPRFYLLVREMKGGKAFKVSNRMLDNAKETSLLRVRGEQVTLRFDC